MPTSTYAKTTVGTVVRFCENAQKTAHYEAGLKQIRDFGFWDYQHPQQPYNPADLGNAEIADLLLSSARLYGFLSVTEKDGQEIPKNFLTEANDVFAELGVIEKQVLCSNHLALCEWRVGKLAEAEIWLQNAFSLQLPPLNPARLHTFIVESLVNCTNSKYEAILSRLTKESDNFLNCGDPYLLGLFYMNRGIAEKNLKNFDDALADQTAARDIFAESGHKQLFAHAENNIGIAHLDAGRLDLARECATRALTVAKKTDDLKLKAGVLDTLAQIYYGKQDYETALKYVSQAVSAIEKTECYGYWAAYCETKIKVLRKMKKNKKALILYADTMAWAKHFCVPSVCESLTEAIEGIEREEKKGAAKPLLAISALLKFHGYSPRGECFVLQTSTHDYSALGLLKGALVIAEKGRAEKGDRAVIKEIESGDYHLGYLDFDFGIIALEVGTEIELFDEPDVQILGKVIGYCPNPPDAEGYYQVVSFE